MDFFNEWIVKKKKDIRDVVIISSIFFAVFVIMYLILIQMATGTFVTFVPMEFAALIFGVYYFISSLSVEFEYSVVNGDMDIDKIISRRRRKRLLSLKIRDIEYFSRFDEKAVDMINKAEKKSVINAASSISSDNVYIAVFYNNSKKMYLLFEPTEKMVENFASYIPRSLNHTL